MLSMYLRPASSTADYGWKPRAGNTPRPAVVSMYRSESVEKCWLPSAGQSHLDGVAIRGPSAEPVKHRACQTTSCVFDVLIYGSPFCHHIFSQNKSSHFKLALASISCPYEVTLSQ